jgi:hypothetical protein
MMRCLYAREIIDTERRRTWCLQGGHRRGRALGAVVRERRGRAASLRRVPDLSAAASAFPGWPVVLGGHWELDGGTSAAAPLVASAMALLSANLQRRHHPPVGPADGLFYYLARHQPDALYDVVSGNNGFFPDVPAHYGGAGITDLASGLGVPQFAQAAAALPPPGVAPAGPASVGSGEVRP